MEKMPKKGGGKSREQVSAVEGLSLVEQKRQEALSEVLDQLEVRFPVELKQSFVSNEREYKLTSAEDCMVAFAQQNREAVETLYSEIVAKDDYRAEQAVVKLLELFKAYERTVALYAELRSYYPVAAARVEDQLPPLSEIARHGSVAFKQM
jgi:hypothetical protein